MIMIDIRELTSNTSRFNLGQTTIRRDASNWNPYDSGTFVSSASK